MKKWIIHIIYRLFRFLFAYNIGDEVKEVKYENEKGAFDFIVAGIVCDGAIGTFSCLWRQSVFRCGNSAIIHL